LDQHERPLHSYNVRTASASRKGRYLLVKAMLPQAILKYLQVYHAILMANNRFASIANVRIIVARRGYSPGCRPRMDSTGGQPIGRIPSAKSAFAFSSLRFSNSKTAIDCSAIAAVCDTARSLISHLGSLSVIKMEEKNNAGEAEPLRICSARSPFR